VFDPGCGPFLLLQSRSFDPCVRPGLEGMVQRGKEYCVLGSGGICTALAASPPRRARAPSADCLRCISALKYSITAKLDFGYSDPGVMLPQVCLQLEEYEAGGSRRNAAVSSIARVGALACVAVWHTFHAGGETIFFGNARCSAFYR